MSLPKDSLGARTEVLVQGVPIDPLGIGGRAKSTIYLETADGDLLQIRTFDGDERALALTRFLTVFSEERTVRGHRGGLYAALGSEQGPWGVLWQESGGLIVQVSGFATKDETLNAADNVRPVNSTQWQRLKDEAKNCLEPEGPSITR